MLQGRGNESLSWSCSRCSWSDDCPRIFRSRLAGSLGRRRPGTGGSTSWQNRHLPHRDRVILLDQGSLDWAGQENGLSWPWPREGYGTIIRFCQRAGAKSLGFDVLFTEPSKYGVADDGALASEIQKFDNFVSAVFLSRKSGSEKKWPEGCSRAVLDDSGTR